MKRAFVAVVAMLIVGGCASAPEPYKAATGLSYGYTETKRAADFYDVTFQSNNRTSVAMTRDMATMRAAELCQAAGYEYVWVYESSGAANDVYGIDTSPIVEVKVQCLHTRIGTARLVGEVISEVRALYPESMPKTAS